MVSLLKLNYFQLSSKIRMNIFAWKIIEIVDTNCIQFQTVLQEFQLNFKLKKSIWQQLTN